LLKIGPQLENTVISLIKTFRLTAITYILIANVQAAPTTKPTEIIWGKDNGRCRVGLLGFPRIVSAGDPIDGTIIVENTGSGVIPVMLQSNRPVSQIDISANMANGKHVGLTSYAEDDSGWSGRFVLHKLGPAQKLEIPIRLTRLIDMTRTGEYRVTFTFNALSTKPSTQASDNDTSLKGKADSSEVLVIVVKN
jgi:hypothetical protein